MFSAVIDPKLPLPVHIAIIMDGNGRWAALRHKPRHAGHQRGVQVTRQIVRACSQMGIRFLTLYTFSTENWKRSSREINFLMHLLRSYLAREINNLRENNIRVLTIGEVSRLPPRVRQVIAAAKASTKDNTGLTLILALNYGSRREIINAALALAEDLRRGKLAAGQVDEKLFANYLDTADFPDPDLLIRTSGELRLSNFLLWQLSYAEFYPVKTLWPDFSEHELREAVGDFQKRQRRYGAA